MRRFSRGDRVRLSAAGISYGLKDKPNRHATVTGMTGHLVKLVWDGNSPKTIYSYHPDFVELVRDDLTQQLKEAP